MSMPTVKAWADDLRSIFGAAEFDAGLRLRGYLAQENGRTIDTRKPQAGVEVSARNMVIGPLPELNVKAGRGR